LIELTTALAMAAILAMFAGPAFRDMIVSSQLTSATNNFITAVAYARSEAVKRSSIVRIDAIGSWAGGWRVINSSDNSTLRNFDAPANTVAISAAPNITSFQFDGRGLLLGQAAGLVMTVCHSGMTGRQISLSATGRPQLNRTYACP
jgi:type IV fimbrial biogenesis protein FimT